MKYRNSGVCKRIASKFRTFRAGVGHFSSPSTPETTSTATSSFTTQDKAAAYIESIPGTLSTGGPVEIPHPDRSLKACTTKEIAAHIFHLLRLLATAINTRDLGHDSFIWEIFHPEYRFQQDEHLPELSSSLLEHNAKMRRLVENDPRFWTKMEGDDDVVVKNATEVEMLVKVQIVSHGISTLQKVVTVWRYEGERWRCLSGKARSDLMSDLPDY